MDAWAAFVTGEASAKVVAIGSAKRGGDERIGQG